MNYYIWTTGCQMNEYESEELEAAMVASGYSPVDTPDYADLIVLNTCMVRQSAEDKAINKLINMKAYKQRNNGVVIVTGCMAGGDTSELKKLYPFVDEWLPSGKIPEWLEQHAKRTKPTTICSFVPIQQGCNNFCTYCIVPYKRGRERSYLPENIEAKARELVSLGALELTVLGQNVDSYGKDLTPQTDITEVLKRLNNIEGLKRIRFLTNHPKDMTRKVMEAVRDLPKVCEHINLPIQAGNNEILERMNRKYTVEYYLELIDMMREIVPNVSIVTDMIVGFPGETEAQFMDTIKVIEKVRFDAIHIAAYSVRTGTYASEHMPDDIPEEEKERRLHYVEKVQGDILADINKKYLGKSTEVLFESQKNGKWQGRNRNDKLVFVESLDNLAGKVLNVNIDRTTAWSLHGILED